MIAIDNTLVSDDLIRKQFICDLEKCKGACCVEGGGGAPLEESELPILEKIFDKVKPLLPARNLKTIEKLGLYVYDHADKEYTTPLIDNKKECVYVIRENGIAKCAIERVYYEGKIDFKKPISCHLYPVRIKKYPEYDAVNYERWSVCKPACALGRERGVRVFEFLKEALIRKYGEEWYTQLSLAAEQVKAYK